MTAQPKLTDTLHRPLRDLRISVTDRCNFRCVYCMPREVFGRDHQFLGREHLLTFEETARLARIFASLGVEKVRITGGEPLLRRDVEPLVGMLASHPGAGPDPDDERVAPRREGPGAPGRRASPGDGEPRLAGRRTCSAP